MIAGISLVRMTSSRGARLDEAMSFMVLVR